MIVRSLKINALNDTKKGVNTISHIKMNRITANKTCRDFDIVCLGSFNQSLLINGRIRIIVGYHCMLLLTIISTVLLSDTMR